MSKLKIKSFQKNLENNYFKFMAKTCKNNMMKIK